MIIRRRMLSLFFAFLCFLGLFSAKINAISDISVSAQSAILINAENGDIYYSKNANQQMPMASTTKIMTALVAAENSHISDTVSIDRRAVGIEGSSIYLSEGELLTMENLLYSLLLASANDAAAAIAIEIGGSIEGFADMMNEKARELGLENTHFDNPHGLDSETHYTSAHDLAVMTLEALKNETVAKIVSTYKTSFDGENGTRVVINHNKLLKSYEGCIGVKTGFTKRSGRCLVSAAERNGMKLIAVTINAPNDWADHKAMLDAGFDSYHKLSLLNASQQKIWMPVVGGKEQTVLCTNTDEISSILPSNITSENCVISLESPRFLYAPIKTGDSVGKLVCRVDGEIIGESNVTAAYSVEKIEYKKSLSQKILSFFKKLFD